MMSLPSHSHSTVNLLCDDMNPILKYYPVPSTDPHTNPMTWVHIVPQAMGLAHHTANVCI